MTWLDPFDPELFVLLLGALVVAIGLSLFACASAPPPGPRETPCDCSTCTVEALGRGHVIICPVECQEEIVGCWEERATAGTLPVRI